MDTQMKIDGALVRTLREQKSWSQEHLASAAGLSVRTVQRVETESSGSSETRLALGAALGVTASKLSSESLISKYPSAGLKRGRFWGWLGWSIGTASALIAITLAHVFGDVPAGETGFQMGVVCAFAGICAGLMGWIDMQARHGMFAENAASK